MKNEETLDKFIILKLKQISKSLFEKKEFQRAGKINLAIDVLEEIDMIEESQSTKLETANKFSIDCEEMNCNNCKAITGHALKYKDSADISQKAWTCSICGNQKTK